MTKTTPERQDIVIEWLNEITPEGWVLIPTHIKVKGRDKVLPISSIHYVEEDESGDGPLGTCISVEGAIELAEKPL